MTCKRCGVEIELCPECQHSDLLGPAYREAEDPLARAAHWCRRAVGGQLHKPTEAS